MFNKVGSLLRQVSNRSKSSSPILALQVRAAAKFALRIVLSDLDKEIVESVKPTIFKKGVLVVSCSQLMSAELKIRADGLIEEINRELGREIVRSLRFMVG